MINEFLVVILFICILVVEFFQTVFLLFALNRLSLSWAGYDEFENDPEYYRKDIHTYIYGFAIHFAIFLIAKFFETYFFMIAQLILLNLIFYLAEAHLISFYIFKSSYPNDYDLSTSVDEGSPLLLLVQMAISFYVFL